MATKAMAEATATALALMSRTLANAPEPIDPELIGLWADLLTDARLTPAQVAHAAGVVVRREKFFPAPATFIEAVRPREDEETQIEAAWVALLEWIRVRGARASLTHRDLGGDPYALWTYEQLGPERLDDELWDHTRRQFRQEFGRVYRVALAGDHRTTYHAGTFEQANALQGNWQAYPAVCGRPDWTALPPERDELDTAPRTLPPSPSLALPAAPEGARR